MAKAKLHLVFGGRVTDPQTLEFTELDKLDIVGVFADYQRPKTPGGRPHSALSTMQR